MNDSTKHEAVGPLVQALRELAELAQTCGSDLEGPTANAGQLMIESLAAGGKVLCCGNGGSAADAQHFAAELVGRMARERRALPALSLSSDPSAVTALANDYGYERVFARQVEALGAPGDVLLGITTSGRSRNVLSALETASSRGLSTVLLVGANPPQGADVCISIPSQSTQRVQEIHIAVLHALCQRIEDHFAQPSIRSEKT